jgi:hypothetical protein
LVKAKSNLYFSSIDEIFENEEEYLFWFNNALSLIRGKICTNMKQSTIAHIIPEYIEIDFNKSIGSPRLFFPKTKLDTVVIQLPYNQKDSIKQRSALREHKLAIYSSIKSRIEIAIADEFAIKFKTLSNTKIKKKTKKKPTSRE